MVLIYVNLIRNKLKTLEQVPEIIREQVMEALASAE